MPPLEQVRAGIGSFDLILDHVRQRRLDDLARVIRLIGLRRLLSPLVAGVVVVGAVYLALAAGLLWDVGGLLVGLGVVLVLASAGGVGCATRGARAVLARIFRTPTR